MNELELASKCLKQQSSHTNELVTVATANKRIANRNHFLASEWCYEAYISLIPSRFCSPKTICDFLADQWHN